MLPDIEYVASSTSEITGEHLKLVHINYFQLFGTFYILTISLSIKRNILSTSEDFSKRLSFKFLVFSFNKKNKFGLFKKCMSASHSTYHIFEMLTIT